MKRIPQERALALLDKRIAQFEQVLNGSDWFGQNYVITYQGTLELLKLLFSSEKAEVFAGITEGECKWAEFVEYDDFSGQEGVANERQKDHIEKCIAYLKAYREQLVDFYEYQDAAGKSTPMELFVSMSFDHADQEINQYFLNILKALRIEFETGERYSTENILAKVQSRILNAELIIAIFVRRDELKTGGYIAPPWLFKELGIAQGAHKPVIALIEQGVTNVAGLDQSNEVIYFGRSNLQMMQDATIKFLEALTELGLV